MEILGGILMAFSNSVPGVSGGTIAFLLGFFDKMLDCVNTLISPASKNKKQALFFLLRLGTSWLIGFIAAVFVVTRVFETHIYAISSLFIGFIVFSIPLMVYEERNALRGNYLSILWILPGFLFVLLITLFSDFSLSLSYGWARLLLAIPAGALAVSAMIMPGISGSSLMMIFGLYIPIMESLKNLSKLDFSGLPLIACFLVGAILGALCFVKGVKYLLHRFRAPTIYVVLGMMIASVYSIWIGPQTLETPQKIMSFSVFNIPFFLLGGVFIALIEILRHFADKRQKVREQKGTSGKDCSLSAEKTYEYEKPESAKTSPAADRKAEETSDDSPENGETP